MHVAIYIDHIPPHKFIALFVADGKTKGLVAELFAHMLESNRCLSVRPKKA